MRRSVARRHCRVARNGAMPLAGFRANAAGSEDCKSDQESSSEPIRDIVRRAYNTESFTKDFPCRRF